MNSSSKTFALTLAAALAVAPSLARAQAPATQAQNPPSSAAGRNERTKPVADVLRAISRATGVNVVADSSVASRMVPVPAEPSTPQNFEQQIAAVVAALGQGATWAKLHLPAPADGRGYNGDDVSAYALAQAKLLGRVGDAPAGQVEILGQVIPQEKAQAYLDGLKLKPVYLVTNPTAGRLPGEDPNSLWARMTPEQRTQYASDQAARLLRADDASRQAFMQSHMQIMSQLMRQLTPDQRQAMLGGMGGNVRVMIAPGPDGTGQSLQIQRFEKSPE